MTNLMLVSTGMNSRTAAVSSRSALAKFGKLVRRKPPTKARGQLRPRAAQALATLKDVLQSMDASSRRTTIETFKPHIRVALLAFMEQAGKVAPKKRPCVARDAPPDKGGRMWIIRRDSRLKFKGRVYFGSLCVTTREQIEMDVAQRHQEILESVRSAVATQASSNPDLWDDSGAILRICRQVLEACGTSEEALGLSTFVMMRATQWLGSTRIVSPTTSLRGALETRARLLHARATSWEALRAEWIALLRAMDRKMPLSVQAAEAIVDAARRDAMRGQLSRALGAVEHALVGLRVSPQKRMMGAFCEGELRATTRDDDRELGLKRSRTFLDSG